MIDFEAAKRMEDFAQTILDASPANQKKMWKSLESVLTAEEIHGLQAYVGFYHMYTDQQFYNAVKDDVCEQVYSECNANKSDNVEDRCTAYLTEKYNQ